MHLGVPWAQNAKGHLLGDVKDHEGAGRPHRSRQRDRRECLGSIPTARSCRLLWLDPGVGGESLISNACAPQPVAVADPNSQAPRGLPYDFRGEQAARQALLPRPAFSRQGGRLFVRYTRTILASKRHELRSAHRHVKAAMKAYSALVTIPTIGSR